MKGVFTLIDKNYTNPADRGRFGFSESGEYNAGFKGAHVFSALLIAAAIVLAAILCFFIVSFIKANINQIAGSTMLLSLAGGVAALFVILVAVAVVGVGMKIIHGGYKCKYAANEEKFTITTGDDVHTIYYKDVQKVHFLPIMRRGGVCGYNVTIQINGACEEYSIVSDKFLSEKNTPFYIIKERMELIRRAEDLERARQAGKNFVGDSAKPIQSDDIAKAQQGKRDVFDRMTELLGKDAEMPGVGLPRTVPSEEAERIQKVMEKVSPSIDGYSSDMPSVGKNGIIIQPDETYIGEDGRAVSLDDIQGVGMFRAPYPKKVTVILCVAAALLLAWVLYFIFITVVSLPTLVYGLFFDAEYDIMLVSAIIAFVVGMVILKVARGGDEYRYKANGREFIVSKKNRPDEHILYRDVKGVSYKPKKFLWFNNGYEAEIVTVYGVVKFGYCYPRFNRPTKKEDLPFEIIKKHINN